MTSGERDDNHSRQTCCFPNSVSKIRFRSYNSEHTFKHIKFLSLSPLANLYSPQQPRLELKTSFHDFETIEALNTSSLSRNENTLIAVDLGSLTALPKDVLDSTIEDDLHFLSLFLTLEINAWVALGMWRSWESARGCDGAAGALVF